MVLLIHLPIGFAMGPGIRVALTDGEYTVQLDPNPTDNFRQWEAPYRRPGF